MVLAYLAVLGTALTITVALSSAAVVLRVGSWLVGRPIGSVDGWLIGAAFATLGILPWPALLALARALLLPGKRESFRVENRSVGPAAVTIAALDEEEAIAPLVRDFADSPGVAEVIVVDNGSTDGTRALAAAAGARVVHEERRGYGRACIRALREGLRSKQPIVVLCEGDQTFRADDLEKLLPYLKHADLVIGSRTHGALLNGDSQIDSFFALGNVFVAKLLQFRYWDWTIGGRLRLTDVGCTYRAIRAEALRQILPALEVGGNHFGPHMVMAALEHGLRVVEVPVTFWKRVGSSKGGSVSWGTGFRLGLAMIWHILTYRVRIATGDALRADGPVAEAQTLRVLFLATRDGHHPDAAGGDIQTWEYARYLAASGHSVTLLAAASAGSADDEVVEGVRVVRLGGVMSLWLHTFLYYMRFCRGRYDVVVAEGIGGSRIPRLAPLYVREPIITEWRQIYAKIFAHQYPRLLTGPLNTLEAITAWLHRDTYLLAFTSEWQEAFQSLGFKRDRIFHVPISIREDWLNGNGAQPATAPTVVWIGKFHRYKCPHHLILAMTEVVKEVPNARLILAGRRTDPRYERELQRLADSLHLGDRVEVRFNISDEAKRALLRHARTLALPSAVEGFGIVILEANASGVPVIASTGVPEDAVRDGHNGLRYPFGDVRALARGLIRLLTDDALHSTLSSRGRTFAGQFAWESVGKQFESVVKLAAARRRADRVAVARSRE